MSNRESDRTQEIVDQIDEALSWEPGDPIHEEERAYLNYPSVPQYGMKPRCEDCDVTWEGMEQDCWMCGKTVPKLTEWWKNMPGSDHSMTVRLDIDTSHFNEQMERMWAAIQEPRIREFSMGFRAVGDSMDRATGQMRYLFDSLWAVPMRRLSYIPAHRQGRSLFLSIMDEVHMETGPNTELVTQYVEKERLDQVPRTPKVFDFDLGLPKGQPGRLDYDVNTSRIEVWEIDIPREFSTEIAPPMPEPRPVMIGNRAKNLLDSLEPSFARSITHERRSRHI